MQEDFLVNLIVDHEALNGSHRKAYVFSIYKMNEKQMFSRTYEVDGKQLVS